MRAGRWSGDPYFFASLTSAPPAFERGISSFLHSFLALVVRARWTLYAGALWLDSHKPAFGKPQRFAYFGSGAPSKPLGLFGITLLLDRKSTLPSGKGERKGIRAVDQQDRRTTSRTAFAAQACPQTTHLKSQPPPLFVWRESDIVAVVSSSSSSSDLFKISKKLVDWYCSGTAPQPPPFHPRSLLTLTTFLPQRQLECRELVSYISHTTSIFLLTPARVSDTSAVLPQHPTNPHTSKITNSSSHPQAGKLSTTHHHSTRRLLLHARAPKPRITDVENRFSSSAGNLSAAERSET